MITARDVEKALFARAPGEMAFDWDNVGLLVGRPECEVQKVLVALDITRGVVEEAAATGCQLIVAHHPVMNIRWHERELNSLRSDTRLGGLLMELVRRDIAAICMHTNLDAVSGGVNDALARRLGLADTALLSQDGVDGQGRPYGIGRVGTVEEQSVEQFARFVKERLGANGVRFVDAGRPVKKVAVGGGACGDMVWDALGKGCDTFVTSDVKYDGFLDAKALGLNLIDAGHYPTENVVCPVLKSWLEEDFPGLVVNLSGVHHEVFSYL